MAWLRKFIEPIHREIRQQVDLAMKQYRQDLAAYHALGKEKAKMEMPQMPKNSMFIISGNNTGTGILQNIIDSDGTGIISRPRRIPSPPLSGVITGIGAIRSVTLSTMPGSRSTDGPTTNTGNATPPSSQWCSRVRPDR